MTSLALPPEQLESMLTSIAAAIGFGQNEMAIETADAVLALEPDQPDAALLKAEVLTDLGHHAEALATLEPVAAHHGDHAIVWQRLGDVALNNGDSERAVEAYRQSQRLAGPTADNEAALALGYLIDLDLRRARAHADAAVAAGADDDTRTFATRLGELDDEADVESEAGWSLGALGASEPGLALLRASLARRPQPETHRRIGALLAGTGRVGEAITHFRTAVEAEPHRTSWRVELGTGLLLTGDVAGAAAQFDEILASSPTDQTALIGAGRVDIARGELQHAVELADRLLDGNPDDAAAWMLRSDAHLAGGHPAHALVDAEHAIVSTPTEQSVWVSAAAAAAAAGHEALAHRYRAKASVQLSGSWGLAEGDEVDDLPDQLEAELHELDPIVVADPYVRGIYVCRSRIADSLLDARRALAYLGAAIDREAVDVSSDVRCYRATLLVGIGDLDQAEAELRAVLADDPSFEPAREGLAGIERRRSTMHPSAVVGHPWMPTHYAPPNGTAGYHAPGGTEPPIADLQPGLPVQLVEQSGNWAHLRCENDWECWADLTLLVPTDASWTPTHRIPGTGMASRTTPYPGADDAGQIAGGLPVAVITRVGGWAHVRFENSWTCWVAGEPLEPLS